MIVHRLIPTIDVHVDKVGYCKALFIIDYGDQINSMWKCRVYETGKVVNAYDDQITIYDNPADGEKPINA